MKLNRIQVVLLGCLILLPSGLGLSAAQVQTNTNAVAVSAEVRTTNGVRSVSARVHTLEEEVAMSFGLERIQALQPLLFGTPLWKYAASMIFILLAICVAKVLDWVIGVRLKKWAEGRPSKLPGLMLNLLHGPIKVVSFVILVHIGLEALSWPPTIQIWFSKALQIVVACSITYMAVKSVDVLVDYWRQRPPAREDRVFNEQLFPVVNKTLKGFIVIVAIMVTCQNLGLDITTMLASLSIGGLALGLAAQDTVANLFGAVAVFVDKPFRVGDRIKLEGIDGVVETIGLRSTRVRNLDGYLITVPNKTMGNATITNVTRRPNIKTEMNIGITYDTSADKVKRALEILDQIYGKHPMTQDLIVGFNKFADSALNINVVHWWKSTDYRAYVAGMQELNLAVKQRFDAEGIEFAFPTQTLYVKQDADGRSSEPPSLAVVPDNGSKRL
jgi:MscS family membrane protein